STLTDFKTGAFNRSAIPPDFYFIRSRLNASPRSMGGRLANLFQRYRIHAITQPARRRTVGKNMAEMGVARIANRLDPLHPMRPIHPVSNRVRRNRLRERRPPGARIEFLRSVEKQRFATKAGIDAGLKKTAHFGTERALRARRARNAELLRVQLRAPFRFCLDELPIRRRIAV